MRPLRICNGGLKGQLKQCARRVHGFSCNRLGRLESQVSRAHLQNHPPPEVWHELRRNTFQMSTVGLVVEEGQRDSNEWRCCMQTSRT